MVGAQLPTPVVGGVPESVTLHFTSSLHFIYPEVCKTEKVDIQYKNNILGGKQ